MSKSIYECRKSNLTWNTCKLVKTYRLRFRNKAYFSVKQVSSIATGIIGLLKCLTEDDLKRIFDGEEFIDFIKNQSLYFDPISSGKDFNLPFLNADHLKLNTDYPEKMEIKYSIFSDDPLISQVIIAIL